MLSSGQMSSIFLRRSGVALGRGAVRDESIIGLGEGVGGEPEDGEV